MTRRGVWCGKFIFLIKESPLYDGHKLFTAVEWWMYLYMVIDGLLILGICVIGGVLVVGGLCEKNMTTQKATPNGNEYGGTGVVV